MTFTVEAVYEAGMLKLLNPLPMEEGEQVKVTIVMQNVPQKKTPAAILANIAALPSENLSEDGFSGADHDTILYGQQ